MLYAICFNLDPSKILSSGNGVTYMFDNFYITSRNINITVNIGCYILICIQFVKTYSYRKYVSH